MTIDSYRKRVTALVVEAARDDPEFVLAIIERLRESGEVSADDLQHIERIACKWARINRDNRALGLCSQR